ncbi:AAA family ATPase [Desulfonema magnum]|uniref:AAA family ATPase n=1 Tax=Desulfonema magnum TaxID=45655 RepID=A0A975GJX1_9BACT|nr:ATP-binding protein [Desulfonema magnum]QTA84086.1 AAA family ATPase [Desulfonema magnum]
MIKEIQLQDWKSFKLANLYIDPLTVLIGTNASGKSNALDAFLFLQRITSGISLSSALQGGTNVTGLRGGIEWVCRKGQNVFSLQITVEGGERTEFVYTLEAEVVNQNCLIKKERLERKIFRPRTKKNPYIIRLFWTGEIESDVSSVTAYLYNEKRGTQRPCTRNNSVLSQLLLQTGTLRKEVAQGIETVSRKLQEIFILDPVPSHMRDYSPLSDKLKNDASNIAGVIAALPAESKTNIENTLTNYVKHLPEKDVMAVYSEYVGKFKTDAMLYCEEKWTELTNSTTIDARGMSDGTLRFLAVLTALLTRPTGSLLIVEEIDNGLHPSRSKLLIKVLKKIAQERNIDILVTTHNPALLDNLGSEMIPFIVISHRDNTTGHSQLTLLEDIDELPKLLARGPVGKLSGEGRLESALRRKERLI